MGHAGVAAAKNKKCRLAAEAGRDAALSFNGTDSVHFVCTTLPTAPYVTLPYRVFS